MHVVVHKGAREHCTLDVNMSVLAHGLQGEVGLGGYGNPAPVERGLTAFGQNPSSRRSRCCIDVMTDAMISANMRER